MVSIPLNSLLIVGGSIVTMQSSRSWSWFSPKKFLYRRAGIEAFESSSTGDENLALMDFGCYATDLGRSSLHLLASSGAYADSCVPLTDYTTCNRSVTFILGIVDESLTEGKGCFVGGTID